MKNVLSRCAVLIFACTLTGPATADVDEQLPDYQKISGVSGNLTSMGSDTLANLMAMWAEEFSRTYPNVNIQIQAAGSSTAAPALTEGTSNLGPMSRRMKDTEVEAFERRHGYKPTAIAVAIDGLAIFVHQDNPITGLDLQQIDAIFSSTRMCGGPDDITHWGQLGLGGSWSNRSIQLYGRNSVAGTNGFFKQHVLCNGDFKNKVNEQPGSGSVVQSVSSSLNGIGYSGIGYKTSSVRAIPIARDPGTDFVEASPENVINDSYPLNRLLYVYINKKPGAELDPLTVQFLTMVLSKQGQAVVVKGGYIPLPQSMAKSELIKLN